jgi:hypothetical protein
LGWPLVVQYNMYIWLCQYLPRSSGLKICGRTDGTSPSVYRPTFFPRILSKA